MSELFDQIGELTPEQRALLEMLMAEQGLDKALLEPAAPPAADGMRAHDPEQHTFALSFAQSRLWFLDQLEPGSAQYNIPMAVRLSGRLDLAALEGSIARVVSRHEALRTVFTTEAGQPVQVVLPELVIPLEVVDLCDLPPAGRQERALQLAGEEARRPFDLEHGPLLRTRLLRLDEGESIILLNMHHIISDGWSMGVLINEIVSLYGAYHLGQPSPLAALAVQYPDYAEWQRAWLQGEQRAAQVEYWKQQLSGELRPLQLPTDRPRPAMQSGRGASLSFHVEPALAEAIKGLGRQCDATLFMTLLAGFQALLQRYTGQEDFCIGTPVANRSRAEIEALIGFFVNTLVVRADLSGGPSFRQLLGRVRETALQAYAHQDLPFEMLVEELQPERDLSSTPLFQVMFILQNMPARGVQLPELHLDQIETHSGTATFDLTLILSESPGGLQGVFEYNTDLFNAATIQRLSGHFVRLLAAIAADPDAPVERLPMLSATELHQALVTWNDTQVSLPETSVEALIARQAQRNPEAPSVIWPAAADGSRPRQALSYAELEQRATRLAGRLRRAGAGPDSLVGLCVERSFDLIVGLLGILKAGAAYLPLDPSYPAERLAFMLSDAASGPGGLPVVLTQAHLVDRLPQHSAVVMCVEPPESPVAPASLLVESVESPVAPASSAPASSLALRKNGDAIAGSAGGDHLAYVIYTSGSTGQPKGVMVSRRAMLNHNLFFARQFGLTPQARVLQFATINFDAAVEEIFPALMSGAALVLRPDALLLSPRELADLARAEKITIFDLPTAYWHEWVQDLAQSEKDANGQVSLPPDLRLVIVGGEKALGSAYQAWTALTSGRVELLNTYGPTETTVSASFFPAPAKELAELPIGRPIANTHLYILDRLLQPVPVGAAGELCIGGLGVARGYLNRPELTAERFVQVRLQPGVGEGAGEAGLAGSAIEERVYRTGDLCRFLPDGNIEFLGRADQQVKVRGFRVELGEIENALVQHPAVAQAAVIAVETRPGASRLLAYIVPAGMPGSAAELVSEVRQDLKARLPEYMLPAAIMALPALPLTLSGKVDRKALPEPGPGVGEALETTPPATPSEEVLAGLFAQLLGLAQVGGETHFFESGGHSLLATQLVSRVREVFGVELPVRAIFEQPDVSGLARRIDAARQQAQGVLAPRITAVDRAKPLPLSFGQQRLWFLDQLEPGSAIYNIPDGMLVRGRLNIAALEASLNAIVRRHEVLRTSFITVDGAPRPVISDEVHLPVAVVDLSAWPAEKRQAEATRLAIQEGQQPFDLQNGPLLRMKVFRLGDEEALAAFTMHHIVSDGWSSTVLMRELARLYPYYAAESQVSGSGTAQDPLPELPVQYADFAAWQRAWLQGEALDNQAAYWRSTLAGLPPLLELPTDRPRPATPSGRGAHLSFALPAGLAQQAAALSRAEGATLFMTLLAAFQALLSRVTGQDDIAVGTPIANRSRAEVENLIGFFVNTLVLRGDLAGRPSFRELVRRVRETCLGAYAHQDLPFEMLVDALQPERNLSYTPLFQVMFMLQPAGRGELSLPDLTFSPVTLDTGSAMFDLTLSLSESEAGLSGALEYNTDLFDTSTMQRLANHFGGLLAKGLADPDRPLGELAWLDAAEQRLVLDAWNDTQVELGPPACLHALFEAQVERTPHALALLAPSPAGDQAQTYAELNRRANQLAHYLRSQGVGPGSLVGVSLERSPELMAALLGILKAGGAYLPLDPTYPPERLAYMLRDAGVNLVLTQAALRASLAAYKVELFCLDHETGRLAGFSAANPQNLNQPDDLAYVIYTSGSTGQPKGVMIPHQAVANHNLACVRAFGLQPSDRVLQFATINFDTAVEEIFPTWFSGAGLVLRPNGALPSGAELVELCNHYGLTVLDLPTAYWHAWVYELSLSVSASSGAALPESLRLVIVGGEKCLKERFLTWHSLAGSRVRWLNTYGPTEATVIASLSEPTLSEVERAAELPIGRPIANVRLYVLDADLQPVPVGVAGELCIAGQGLARGYLNQPDLTAEKFTWIDLPGPGGVRRERVYRTGDRVRWRPDGQVEFLGRVDHQVKVRGFRVELGEIDAALTAHAEVREAVTLLREDQPDQRRLVAYVSAAEEAAGLAGRLRAHLKEKLPEYMLPARIEVLPSLPHTPSGKINRFALPLPAEEAAGDGQAAFEGPVNETEQTLHDIWARTLGRASIGRHDNFFELGGDSILSIQIIARAAQAGLRLTPRDLFENPTIGQLAQVSGRGVGIIAEQEALSGPLSLTPIQRWFFEQELPAAHHWNQALLFELRQAIDPGVLRAAVHGLQTHHDALRLRFTLGANGWEQAYAGLPEPPENTAGEPFVSIDLSGAPEPGLAAAIEGRCAALQESLDLAAGPIWRVAHFDLGPEQPGRLFIAIHHLAVDGVSWRILLEDLQTAYQQISRGEAVRLPPKTTSFRRWAERLAELANTPETRGELAHWQSAGAAPVPLPVDFEQGDNREASAASLSVSLSMEDTRVLLEELPGRYRTEINDVLLTALATAVCRWTQAPAASIALEGHGRENLFDDVDISRTVGWFTTLFPLRLELAGAQEKPLEALKRVKAQLRSVPRRGIGYGLLRYLQAEPGGAAVLGGAGLPEISFNYLGQVKAASDEPGLLNGARERRGPDRSPLGQRSHLIEVDGVVSGGRLQVEWTYSQNVHRPATIARAAADFIAALENMIRPPETPEPAAPTPADFPLAQLDQKRLDKVLGKLGKKR